MAHTLLLEKGPSSNGDFVGWRLDIARCCLTPQTLDINPGTYEPDAQRPPHCAQVGFCEKTEAIKPCEVKKPWNSTHEKFNW